MEREQMYPGMRVVVTMFDNRFNKHEDVEMEATVMLPKTRHIGAPPDCSIVRLFNGDDKMIHSSRIKPLTRERRSEDEQAAPVQSEASEG